MTTGAMFDDEELPQGSHPPTGDESVVRVDGGLDPYEEGCQDAGRRDYYFTPAVDAPPHVPSASRRAELRGVRERVLAGARAAGHDPVNWPAHYTLNPSGVECITVVEHLSFCVGNAIKYLWRAGLKGDAVEDLRKARWYIDREIVRLEGKSKGHE